MPSHHQIERIYTDGACSGNPGPGGWGVVAYLTNGMVHELGGRDTQTTNNRMELQAAIAALQLLRDTQQVTSITLYTDSEYVKKGITQWISSWKKKKWKTSTGKAVVNLDLWQQLDELNTAIKKQLPLTWEYVRGHAGDEGNERSDAIARAFSQNSRPALHRVNALATPAAETSSQRSSDSAPSLSSSPMAKSTSKSTPKASASKPSASKPSAFKPSTSTSTASSSESSSEPRAAVTDDGPPRNSDLGHLSAIATLSAEPSSATHTEKLAQLRSLVETFQLADTLADQRYLITTHELADLVGISITTATNRGESWVWRNWRVSRVRQESNQILWQLERVI